MCTWLGKRCRSITSTKRDRSINMVLWNWNGHLYMDSQLGVVFKIHQSEASSTCVRNLDYITARTLDEHMDACGP